MYLKDSEIIPSWSCLQNGSLNLFEQITTSDVIPLTNTIRLIRHHRPTEYNRSNQWLVEIFNYLSICKCVKTKIQKFQKCVKKKLKTQHPRRGWYQSQIYSWALSIYVHSHNFGREPTHSNFTGRQFGIDNKTWSGRVLNRFADIFTTHVIQLDIETTGLGKSKTNYLLKCWVQSCRYY